MPDPTDNDSEVSEVSEAPRRRRLSWLAMLGSVGALPFAIAVLLGMLGGVGAFTFGYGDGAAYFSNDPEACANCHVMQGHYDSWIASGHSHVAVCNDCHLPPGALNSLVTKMDNGFFHSLAFTTGGFPEPIRIKERNRKVTQRACLSCHSDYVNNMLPYERGGDMLLCVSCHSEVGHRGRR